MPALTGWHFCLLLTTYLVAGAAGAAGIAGVVAGASVFSMILESVSLKEPVKLKLESKISAIKIVANVQVLLSKKSVVFCTPPNI
jgi:hypothetical protein